MLKAIVTLGLVDNFFYTFVVVVVVVETVIPHYCHNILPMEYFCSPFLGRESLPSFYNISLFLKMKNIVLFLEEPLYIISQNFFFFLPPPSTPNVSSKTMQTI